MKTPMSISALRRSVIGLALVAVPALALACSGSVGDPGGSPGATGGAASGTGGSAGSPGVGSGGAGPGGGVGGAASTPEPGSSGVFGTGKPESAGILVMRRMTNREYNNTVRDLLKDTTAPGNTFPLEGATDSGFTTPSDIPALNVQYYMEAADTLAETAVKANPAIIPCTAPANKAAEDSCATKFIADFGRKAYRRPVVPAEAADLLKVYTTVRALGVPFTTSVAQVLKVMLQSPNFLYHWELGPKQPVAQGALVSLTPHQIASRLSYLLWETMPDDALLTAADADQLSTPEQIAAQATRMIPDTRAQSAFSSFHTQWLHIDDLAQAEKDAALYPSFNDAMKTAMAQELSEFVKGVLMTGPGTLKELLTAPYTYVNGALAPLYGNTAVKGAAFAKVDLDPTQRAGIMTQTAFLAFNATPGTSHPIKRGLVVWRQLLCGDVPPPPANVPEVSPPAPNTTTRERYTQHHDNKCASCHTVFDPPGFAFENYDAIGAYRKVEATKPVDASGTFTTPGGTEVTFTNATQMMQALAGNAEVQSCVARQWFRYMAGRLETADDEGSLQLAYAKAKAADGYSVRDLLLQMVQSTAFRFRKP